MVSRGSFRNATNKMAVLGALLGVSTAFLWTGGALSGENPRFAWMAPHLQAEARHDPATTPETKHEQIYLGSAPWICTPSGFGQTSTCREREMHVRSNE
jgi:hypothetical protein